MPFACAHSFWLKDHVSLHLAQDRVEFADRLFGGKFQAVVSTHLNTKCIHNHIVWNSVSMENGKKYRSNEKNYVTGVWKISDELCVKHLFCNYVINMFVKS